jgi:hypothetical protein
MPGDLYRTSDLYYAAYLKVAGVPLVGTEKEKRRVFFLFENLDPANIQRLKNQYFMDQSKVSALSYAQAIKALKGMVFAER